MILDIVKIGAGILDKVIPDPEQRAKAKAELIALEAQNQLEATKTQLSAIISESQSEDPWTSRARPSFLYVVYTVILAGLPMGFMFAISPETASNVTQGFKQWLEAIPEQVYTLFAVGYLGYTGARSLDKRAKKD